MLTVSVLALAWSYSGMLCLSLAMDRHFEQVANRRSTPLVLRWVLRGVGVLLLVSALAACLAGWGAGVGWVTWLGFLSAGALVVAVAMPYASRAAAVVAAGVALIAAAVALLRGVPS